MKTIFLFTLGFISWEHLKRTVRLNVVTTLHKVEIPTCFRSFVFAMTQNEIENVFLIASLSWLGLSLCYAIYSDIKDYSKENTYIIEQELKDISKLEEEWSQKPDFRTLGLVNSDCNILLEHQRIMYMEDQITSQHYINQNLQWYTSPVEHFNPSVNLFFIFILLSFLLIVATKTYYMVFINYKGTVALSLFFGAISAVSGTLFSMTLKYKLGLHLVILPFILL